MNNYPLETVETAYVAVGVNKVTPIYTNVEFAITLLGSRPTGVLSANNGNATLGNWFPAITDGTQIGFKIFGLSVGKYYLWAKIFNNTDTPVILVDQFNIV